MATEPSTEEYPELLNLKEQLDVINSEFNTKYNDRVIGAYLESNSEKEINKVNSLIAVYKQTVDSMQVENRNVDYIVS